MINRKGLVRSAAFLTAGAGIGQIISALMLPLLVVLYSPADVGSAQSFASILTILGMVACGKLDQAILVVPEDTIPEVFAAGFYVLSMLAALTLVGLFVGHFFFSASIPTISWLLPFSLMFVGFAQLVSAVALRRRAFDAVGRARIEQSALALLATAVFGFLKFGSYGLVFAQVVQQFGGTLRLRKRAVKEITLPFILRARQHVPQILRANRHLLVGATGSALVNNLAWSSPVIAIAHFYSLEAAGFFGLAMRCLSPVQALLTTTMGQLTLGEGARLIAEGRHAELKRQLVYFSKISSGLGLVIATCGWLAGELAARYLTNNWAQAAHFLFPLGILVAAQSAIGPISNLSILYSQQGRQFTYDLVRAVLVALLFILGGAAQINLEQLVQYYVAIMLAAYLLYARFFVSLLPRAAIDH